MQTLTDRLLATDTHAFNVPPLPEILTAYKEYVATGKYPYLSDVDAFAVEKYKLPPSCAEALHHQSYLASQEYRREAAEETKKGLVNAGWIEINLQNWADVPTTGRAELRLDTSDDMFGGVNVKVCRLIANTFKLTKDSEPQTHAFFLPGRARSKGWDAYHLATRGKSAYYRMI
jgi:hypothetical protein